MYKRPSLFLWVLLLSEISLFIIVGKLIGLFSTILLVILTSVLGTLIISQQKFNIKEKLSKGFRPGKPPMLDLMDDSMVILAGVLLMIPGFITDTLGFLCLISPLRKLLLKYLVASKMFSTKPINDDKNIIDAEYWRDKNELPPEE